MGGVQGFFLLFHHEETVLSFSYTLYSTVTDDLVMKNQYVNI